jgi:hypothetical protein
VNTLELAVTGPHVQVPPLVNAQLQGRVAALETGLTRVEAKVEALSPRREVSGATHEEQRQVASPETGLNRIETRANALDPRVEAAAVVDPNVRKLATEIERLNRALVENTSLIRGLTTKNKELSDKNSALQESINAIVAKNEELERRLNQLEQSQTPLRNAGEQRVRPPKPPKTNVAAASPHLPRGNVSAPSKASAPIHKPTHTHTSTSSSASVAKRDDNGGNQAGSSMGSRGAGLFDGRVPPTPALVPTPAPASIPVLVLERSEDSNSSSQQIRSLRPTGMPSG